MNRRTTNVLEEAFLRADTVTPKSPTWLPTPMGPGWIARTGVTVLAGMQDLGKTGLAMGVAARVTEVGSSVLVFSAEDDPETTLVPRLMAAGADRGRVHIFKEETDFWLTESSTGLLDDALRESKAKLVVFDPLLAYFSSGTDSHRDRDVRAVLRRVSAVSRQRKAALLGLMHFNKADHAEILHYVSSSIAFTAAPRSVLAMVNALDPDDDSLLLIHAKCNVAAKRLSRVLRREPVKLGGSRIKTYRMVVGEESDITSRNYVAKRRELERNEGRSERAPSALDDAVRDLEEFLREGPKKNGDVKAWMIDGQMHAWRTVRRAKDVLGVILEVDPDGQAGRDFLWRLPQYTF